MLAHKLGNIHPYIYAGLNRNITLDISVKKTAKTNPTFIIQEVCRFFNLRIEDVVGEKRKRELVIARQLSMFFLKEFTTLSLKKIGGMLGGRDHSTVIYAMNTVNDLCDTDASFNKIFANCRNHILLADLKTIMP